MSRITSSPLLSSQGFGTQSSNILSDLNLADSQNPQINSQSTFFGNTQPNTQREENQRPAQVGEEAEIVETAREIRNQRNLGDIPKVVDETSEKVQEAFEKFLNEFTVATDDDNYDPRFEGRVYISRISKMSKDESTILNVDYQHLLTRENGILASAITEQYYRFLPYLQDGLRKVINKHSPSLLRRSTGSLKSDDTLLSVERIFQISFYNLSTIHRIRELRAESIGMLMSISGTVTRTSEVRPELYKAAFTCDMCKTLVQNVEQTFRYTEPTSCPHPNCPNQVLWTLNIPKSSFTDWQKVRIQENSSEIPTGSMPRTLDIILRGELVEKAKPGDKCKFTGTEIVIPDVSQLGLPGFKPSTVRNKGMAVTADGLTSGISMKSLGARDLTYKIAFFGCHVSSMTNKELDGVDNEGEGTYESILDNLTESEVHELKAMVANEHVYPQLVESICPTVFGHEVVKKGILLQLLGGVHKKTVEGINLRGDINVCIVGDPSCAKSQFLKWVNSFAPRAIYTSGKASTAAGLTASVVKDEESGEFTIEAGALMLADNGVCCIDEFDKMDIADQVAIHEAMEQQTISIAKAGIHATLNARTSILAAANPIGGRYNQKISLKSNLSMTGPILSRFDLFFVILDECNERIDTQLANHIVNLHLLRDDAISPPYTKEQLLTYIKYVRTFKPKMSSASRDYLIQRYKELRSDDAKGFGRSSYRITVRQLESLIRLSEAIARANCTENVTPEFVAEAYELLRQSIIRVEKDDVEVDDNEEGDGDDDENHEDDNERHRDDNENHRIDDEGMHMETEQRSASVQSQTQHQQEAHKVTIPYDMFVTMRNMFIRKIRDKELEQEHSANEENDDPQGYTQNELVSWYMLQIEDELENEKDYWTNRKFAKRVLKKLVKDNILMRVNPDATDLENEIPAEYIITPDMSPEEKERVKTGYTEWLKRKIVETNRKMIYILHPNCSLEDIFDEVIPEEEFD